jgi:hypothetical protein
MLSGTKSLGVDVEVVPLCFADYFVVFSARLDVLPLQDMQASRDTWFSLERRILNMAITAVAER